MGYFVITGGELFNKGAQAMTFILVDELKKRFPQHKIVVFSSNDYLRDNNIKDSYNFEILPWTISTKLNTLGGIYSIINKILFRNKDKKFKKEYGRIEEIIKNTVASFDISGYALSSQFGFQITLNYLLNLKVAKSFGFASYIMPQSFGPFNYKPVNKFIFNMLKGNLKYPKKIYAREAEGYNFLKNYTKDNVHQTLDMVLQHSSELDLKNIFTNPGNYDGIDKLPGINENSVAIVPNTKIMKHGRKEELINIYEKIVAQLLQKNLSVYLIRHSFDDLDVCREIKSRTNNSNVIVFENDFDCIQLNDLIKHFKFVIASRYHSIVHSYKNSVPCIVFGWAIKYKELLKVFDQEKYLFDVRQNLDYDIIKESVDNMCNQYSKESQKIRNKLGSIQNKDIMKDLLD